MSTHQNTPEVLYADTTAKKRAYADLSHRYAASGDAYGAVHAAWAADVQTVQAVMWERVMIASPQPDQQFFAVATTVARALALYVTNPTVAADARGAVENARQGMAGAFDVTALRILSEQYISLDHLNEMPLPDLTDQNRIVVERLQGEPLETVVARRREVARDSMQVAVSMHRERRDEDAMTQAYQADWATLEAYLLESAVAVGDTNLVTVDMRWMLAADAISKISALPTNFTDAVASIRRHMVSSLGTIEGARLAEQFEPVG